MKVGDYVVNKDYGLCRITLVYWGTRTARVEVNSDLTIFLPFRYLPISKLTPATDVQVLEAKLKGLI